MMEKYQENNVNRDIFYEEQKRDKIKAAQEEVRKAKEEERAKKALEDKDASEEYPIDDEPIKEETSIEDMEPEPEPESESASGEAEEATVKKGSEVSDDIKDSLESDDPWMQRKNTE
jgi:hypothetical protein